MQNGESAGDYTAQEFGRIGWGDSSATNRLVKLDLDNESDWIQALAIGQDSDVDSIVISPQGNNGPISPVVRIGTGTAGFPLITVGVGSPYIGTMRGKWLIIPDRPCYPATHATLFGATGATGEGVLSRIYGYRRCPNFLPAKRTNKREDWIWAGTGALATARNTATYGRSWYSFVAQNPNGAVAFSWSLHGLVVRGDGVTIDEYEVDPASGTTSVGASGEVTRYVDGFRFDFMRLKLNAPVGTNITVRNETGDY